MFQEGMLCETSVMCHPTLSWHRFPSFLFTHSNSGASRKYVSYLNFVGVIQICQTRTEQGHCSVRGWFEQNCTVLFCSMHRRTRANRTGLRRCFVLFVCLISHLWSLPICIYRIIVSALDNQGELLFTLLPQHRILGTQESHELHYL